MYSVIVSMSLVCGPPRLRNPSFRCVVVTFSVCPSHCAGREAAPAVRRVGRRMRPVVEVDRPIERAHELHPVAEDVAGDRIELLEDARAADAAPLMRRRVRPALVLRRAPDRFGRRVGAQAAGFVEGEAEIVRQRTAAPDPRPDRAATRRRCQERGRHRPARMCGRSGMRQRRS